RRVRRAGARWTATTIDAGPEAGARGLAIGPSGVVYVSSPPARGVKVISLGDGGVLQVMPTGISPRALRLVPAGTLPDQAQPLLLVSNFVDHTVTVHPVDADGRLAPAVQTIATDPPVL